MEIHIRNLITKFGSFNYAKDGTPLDGGTFERFLYETIPGAWQLLGKSVVPRPISKPEPAPPRRKSTTLPTPPTSPTIELDPAVIIASGRVITRRISGIIEKFADPDGASTANDHQWVKVDRAGLKDGSKLNGSTTNAVDGMTGTMGLFV